MQQQAKKKRPKVWYCLLISLGICILFTAIAMYVIPLYENQFYTYTGDEKPSTIGFPPKLSGDSSPFDEVDSPVLTVFCDTSANMLGFVAPSRGNCIESSYQEMLNRIESNFDSRSITFQSFNANGLSEVSLNTLLSAESYVTDSAQGDGLEQALRRAATTNDPVIILTDLEGSLLNATARIGLEEQFKAIFKAHRSVSVTRYISAYSGTLTNYAGSDLDYGYGTSTSKIPQIKPSEWTEVNHRLPRAFYAIVIGNTETCASITDSLNALYRSINNSLSSYDHSNPPLSAYTQMDTIRHPIIKASLLQGYRPGSTSETGIWVAADTLTDEDIAASQWKDSYGVYRFSFKRDELTNGVFTIPFTINTRLISDNKAAKTALTAASAEIYLLRIDETHETLNESNQDQLASGDLLLARGNRAIRLALVKDNSDEKCFHAVASVHNDQTVELTFTADPTQILPGVYRIEIKVTAQQDRALMDSRIEQLLSPYSITEALAKSNASSLSSGRSSKATNPAIQTVGLQFLLTALSNGYVSQEAACDLEIADIIFDLHVE